MRYRRVHPPPLASVTGPRFSRQPTTFWPGRWLAAVLLATGAAGAAPQAGGRFSFYGLAPAAAGQDRAKAEAALGQALQPEPMPAARAASAAASATSATNATNTTRCHYRLAAQQPGVRYAMAGEVITRMETRDARYATVSGLHVGDSVARARQIYGKRLASAPHPYFDRGQVLSVHSPDRKFALVMEANDQGRIITLRGGRLPEVGWLEGCP